MNSAPINQPNFFLGLDTGYARLGYGILKVAENTNQLHLETCGVIETKSGKTNGERLLELELGLIHLLNSQNLRCCALEEFFMRKSISTGAQLLQARGVILLVLAKYKIPVYSVSPTSMKKMLTGYGLANKQQIQKIVMKLLSLKEVPQPDDAADAIALSLCGWLEHKNLITKQMIHC